MDSCIDTYRKRLLECWGFPGNFPFLKRIKTTCALSLRLQHMCVLRHYSGLQASFRAKLSLFKSTDSLTVQRDMNISSVQFSSVTQLCPTLCDPMNCSTPDPPVHHQLQESTQTHVHRVSDAIQPSHPLSSPSPPALNPSQHQSLFQ